MAGNEQGTMDDKARVKRPVGRSSNTLRSRSQPADVDTGERTGTHRAARIATVAEVLTEASDPRLDRTGTMRRPA